VRQRRHYLLRVLYASFMLWVLWAAYDASGWSAGTPARIARFASAFSAIFCVSQTCIVLLLAPALAGGAIALEREKRTIEYVFVTDLRDYEIILGKFASCVIQLTAIVAAGVPVLALATTIGGVDFELVLLTFVLSADAAVLCTAAAVFCSLFVRRVRDGVVLTYALGILVWYVPPLLKQCYPSPSAPVWVELLNSAAVRSNPLYPLFTVVTAGRSPGPAAWSVVAELLAVHTVAVLAMLVLGSKLLRPVYERLGRVRTGGRFKWLRIGWRPRVGNNAMLWKELFAESSIRSVGFVWKAVTLAVSAGVIALIFFAIYTGELVIKPRNVNVRDFCMVLTSTFGSFTLLLIGLRGAASVTSEKDRGCWELLISAPIEGKEFVTAKLLGGFVATLPLISVLGITWVIGFMGQFLFQTVTSIFVFFVLAVFAFMVGMLYSFKCRNTVRASAATTATLVMCGGGYLLILLLLTGGQVDEELGFFAGPALLAGAYAADMNSWPRDSEVAMYVFGVVCYVAAALLMFLFAVQEFSSLAGRSDRPSWLVWQDESEPQESEEGEPVSDDQVHAGRGRS